MIKTKNKRGFTLIEMIVVVAIIGILTTMILVSVSRIRKNSLDARRKSNIENVRGAITMYYAGKSCWPCVSCSSGCASLSWSNLISELYDGGYLTQNILADEDSDGINDYSVCQCGASGCSCDSGSQVKLSNACELSDGEGCTNASPFSSDSRKLYSLEVK